MPKRIDIQKSDVFISWTSADRDLKNEITGYLGTDVRCLESDADCSGDFEQWSKEAPNACNIFVLILTENTLKSTYVPIEIESFKNNNPNDYKNRIVVVCENNEFYQKEPWGLHECISAVFLDEDNYLEQVKDSVRSLTVGMYDKIYREASKPDYIKLIPFFKTKKASDKQYDYSELYISRSACERDADGRIIGKVTDADSLIKSEDVIFISGPAGIGKTQYINQLGEAAYKDGEIVTIVLPCHKLSEPSTDLFSAMYNEFKKVCGNTHFYTHEHFKSLITNRHILLVVDGMDEIAVDDIKRKIIDKTESYYKANGKNITFVFTSRNRKDADLIIIGNKKVRRFELERLSEKEIETLGGNLFAHFESRDKQKDFYMGIQKLDEEIKSNPLLLSQLAIVYEDSGSIPQTVAGIYEAISKIILKLDEEGKNFEIPEGYKEMLKGLEDILKEFAKERYILLSNGTPKEAYKIFTRVLKDRYGKEDGRQRAEFLVEYLQARSILIEDEFYHKMFLEYFTAVCYYEESFDEYDEMENEQVVAELFAHYGEPYWADVIKMYLVKADSCIDEVTTKQLYKMILEKADIVDYTLLFDICRDLIVHREAAQFVLVLDILQKSVSREYPPYGPLFWYVSEYSLYKAALLAAAEMRGSGAALALVRDVCFMFANADFARDITDEVDAGALYEAAKGSLSGVRNALCELFYTGRTDFCGGEDIYPRCFNVREAKAFAETGCGTLGIMREPFEDELGLYLHEAYNEWGGEHVGFVAMSYDNMDELRKKSCKKLCGLALYPTDNKTIGYMPFNRSSLKVFYMPENIEGIKEYDDWADNYWKTGLHLSLDVAMLGEKKMYIRKKAIIPGGIGRISDFAFRDCTNLTAVSIGDGVTEIGAYAFYGCSALEDITGVCGVQKIGECAFKDCKKLADIVIDDSVVQIGTEAFSGCQKLKKVILGQGITTVCERMFYGCAALEEIIIPHGTKKIGRNAFACCEALKSITIPESVTEIEMDAFYCCSKLKSVIVPDSVKDISYGAFAVCSGLESITIGQGVEQIGLYAFTGCSSLKSIVIPGSVKTIGVGAFFNCSSLSDITIFPDSLEKIDGSVFSECTGLRRIELVGIQTFEGDAAYENHMHLTDVIRRHKGIAEMQKEEDTSGQIEIPQGTTEIKAYAYKNSSKSSVVIPEGVIKIGAGAFSGCENLISVIIPDGVTEIGENAFSGCESLESIMIPESVEKIGACAFADCEALESITIPKGIKIIELSAFENCIGLTEVVIPEGVTKIGLGAFAGCEGLKSIIIPDTVEEIDIEAFENCSGLTDIVIPESVIQIGGNAFAGCESLERIVIRAGITEISSGIFGGCENLTDVVIPSGITKIGENAFAECKSLREIIIPESVEEIGIFAFKCCESLKSINIPEKIDRIDGFVFAGCSELESIIIPEGVEEIGISAFYGCQNLREVKIPFSVTQIDDFAFADCGALESVVFEGTTFEGDIKRIFGDIDKNIVRFIERQ